MYVRDLHEMQKELDDTIQRNNNSTVNAEMIMFAFKVELYELANEIEFFKHWKKHKGKPNQLEEYVDGLHFLLSLGNYYGIMLHEVKCARVVERDFEKDMYVIFNWIEYSLLDMKEAPLNRLAETYQRLFSFYMELGRRLEFTKEQIREAYVNKHKQNYTRQEEGY